MSIKSDVSVSTGHSGSIGGSVGGIGSILILDISQTNIAVGGNVKRVNEKSGQSMAGLKGALEDDAKNIGQLGLDYQDFDESMKADNLLAECAEAL